MNPKKLNKNNQPLHLNDIQKMLASFEDDILPNIPSKDAILQRAKQRKLKQKYIGGALFAICAMCFGLYSVNPSYQQYTVTTERGAQKTIRLSDGSQIMLNTESKILVQQKIRSRDIILQEGEASFHVAHAQGLLSGYFERTFQVNAGKMHIIDIGTIFNVQKLSATDASVSVLQGEVAVGILGDKKGMIHLKQGQSLSNQNEKLNPMLHVDLDMVQAWQTGHIIFNQTPLSNALENFQRYSDFKVELSDPTLKKLPISGQFKAENYQNFMQVLPYVAEVKVSKSSENIWKIAKK